MTVPRTAMVMAAGLGTRMRPLTLDRPKALVTVGGRTLIDHMLDRLAGAGVERVVVNVHAFADQLEAHLARRTDLAVTISDERGALLETGGGLKKARPLLGDDPILVANIDSIWTGGAGVLESLARAWDATRMDDLLLLVRLDSSLGFDGPGDFFRDDEGRLTARGAAASAPLAYIGVQMICPRIIDAWPSGAHGLMAQWLPLSARGRLHGTVMDRTWMHVGDPAAREAAERRLAGAAA